ncbi:MAG: tRNA 2-thiouridine(34) synthase MnmA, partial [Ilumatobacteraceae bacterium]
MKVMCAMSGGVDSSVAALLLQRAGHEVVGVTMKLWGGDSDTGCCSVSDVDDARRVAQQLGIDHLVFNFGDDFDEHVVQPYVDAHTRGITPNPCIECNRSVKFARLAERADLLGFDAVATGHHANIGTDLAGRLTLERGSDHDKDQSYVVHMLDQAQLARTMFPVGGFQKATLRELASEIDLRTADKPDSQDVCFIMSTGGRTAFLGDRIPFRSGTVVDSAGTKLGEVESVELVTIGQRKGIGLPGGGPKRYVVDVDQESRVVTVGSDEDLLRDGIEVAAPTWVDEPVTGDVLVQCSAHGEPRPASIEMVDGAVAVAWTTPQRRVAPGQSVVFYD